MYLQNKERKWILIVDDEFEIRSAMVELLKDSFGDEISIIEAKDGVEATSKINCQAFHCIITDLKMPRKEGGAFLASVRSNAFNESTPVVVVSGAVETEEITKNYPFVCVVKKPFDPSELTSIIKNKMQIGRNDKGVSADVFNNLINTTYSFIASLSNSKEMTSGKPVMKAVGDGVDADMVSTVQVKMGKASNTFSILITNEMVEKVMSTMGAMSGKSVEEVQRTMSQIILKHVMNNSGLFTEKSFDINQINYSKDSLKEKKGIIVPVGTNDIQMKIFATAS